MTARERAAFRVGFGMEEAAVTIAALRWYRDTFLDDTYQGGELDTRVEAIRANDRAESVEARIHRQLRRRGFTLQADEPTPRLGGST